MDITIECFRALSKAINNICLSIISPRIIRSAGSLQLKLSLGVQLARLATSLFNTAETSGSFASASASSLGEQRQIVHQADETILSSTMSFRISACSSGGGLT
jgi:hypothetical protein